MINMFTSFLSQIKFGIGTNDHKTFALKKRGGTIYLNIIGSLIITWEGPNFLHQFRQERLLILSIQYFYL